MNKHTPTPWQYTPSGHGALSLYGPDNKGLWHKDRTDDEQDANARLIVRAVNCHRKLVKALAGCVDVFKDYGYSPTHCDCDPSVGLNTCIYCEACAALARARGDDDEN